MRVTDIKEVTIKGVKHEVWVDHNGVCYIDGITTDKWLESAPWDVVIEFATLGKTLTDAKKQGVELSPKAVLEGIQDKTKVS